MSRLQLGDNAVLRQLDKDAGWVDSGGASPSSRAEEAGVAGHIIGLHLGMPVVAWEHDGLWSYCVLNRYGLGTTLLARSKAGLLRLLRNLRHRVRDDSDGRQWQSYYSGLWARRYRKWCCISSRGCKCQLCRIAKGKRGH